VATHFRIRHFFHIETDVLLYAPIESVLSTLMSKDVNIGVTVLNPHKVIPGIIYFKDDEATRMMVEYMVGWAKSGRNDMDVLGLMWQDQGIRTHNKMYPLPVVPSGYCGDLEEMWSRDQQSFGCIFDGAALGQWIGGVDINCKPGDMSHDTPFVNHEASYRFDTAHIRWDEQHRPYVNDVPVFNLHVHSKQLYKWRSHQ
jgi:hypothetical protein